MKTICLNTLQSIIPSATNAWTSFSTNDNGTVLTYCVREGHLFDIPIAHAQAQMLKNEGATGTMGCLVK